MFDFKEGGNRSTRREPLGVEQRTNKLKSDAESGNRTQATLVGGEWSHHSTIHSTDMIFYFLIFSATASPGTQCPKLTIIVNSMQIRN